MICIDIKILIRKSSGFWMRMFHFLLPFPALTNMERFYLKITTFGSQPVANVATLSCRRESTRRGPNDAK